MDYGKLIKNAWQITWKYKVLWIFGALAALFGGAGWGRGNGLRYTLDRSDLDRWSQMWPRAFEPGYMGRWRLFADPATWNLTGAQVAGLVVLGLLAVLVGIVALLLRYTSMGAMIGIVDDVEAGRGVSFKAGFRRGWSRMLRMVAIDILLALAGLVALIAVLIVFAVLALLVAGPLLLTGTDGGPGTVVAGIWAVLAGLAVLLLFVAVLLAGSGLISIVREYAFRASVIDLKGVRGSIRSAVALFRSRFRPSLLTWLVLVGIGLALAMVMVPITMLAATPLAMAGIAIGASASAPAAIAALVPVMLLAVLVATVLSGVYIAFQSTVWTLAYRALDAPEAELEAA